MRRLAALLLAALDWVSPAPTDADVDGDDWPQCF